MRDRAASADGHRADDHEQREVQDQHRARAVRPGNRAIRRTEYRAGKRTQPRDDERTERDADAFAERNLERDGILEFGFSGDWTKERPRGGVAALAWHDM